MKIIFLDVDGVLNQLQKYHVDRKCVKLLSGVVTSDVRIVLTSSWRMGFDRNIDKCSEQVKKLRKIMQEYGIDVLYRTEKLGDRREEVLSWLNGKNIDSYVILDDDKSEYSSLNGLNFYLVNHKTGLVQKDIKNILKLLR